MAHQAHPARTGSQALRYGVGAPISDEEKFRRLTETRILLGARDSLPSIAPDTTAEYIREVREEAYQRV